MPEAKPCKTWVYTLNHPTKKEIETLKELTVSKHRSCLEVGEEGTPHLQGAITFKRAYRLTQLKKLFPRIHWEGAKVIDAENYCIKGDILININCCNQGKRNDLAEAHTSIKSGMELKEFSNAHFQTFVKYTRGIQAYYNLNQEPRNFVTEVIVLWGESGTGKTRSAVEAGARKVYYRNGFFYGAVDADVVLFDEFDECDMPRSLFLEITDRYECTINVKCGSCNWRPKTIYLTSNIHPDGWTIGCDPAIKRRMTEIRNL